MADLNDQTQNVSIYPEGSTSPITSTTDGAKERLDVSAKVFFDPYFGGTRVNAYFYDADSDVGDVQATHTVTAGKVLYIYQWGISDTSYGTYELQIAGTTVDAVINTSSSSGLRGLNQVTYGIPLQATAGQVVRIYKRAGLSNKETASTIIGIEVNA